MHGFICLETDDNLSGLTESNFDENPDAIDLALGFFCENKEEIVDLTHSFPMPPPLPPPHQKHQKTVRFSDVSAGTLGKGALGTNGLIADQPILRPRSYNKRTAKPNTSTLSTNIKWIQKSPHRL